MMTCNGVSARDGVVPPVRWADRGALPKPAILGAYTLLPVLASESRSPFSVATMLLLLLLVITASVQI